jgi:hypothetical protein
MALMSGQVVTQVFAPVSAGATAVYTSSGLSYYRHPDWLGSSRVASTPSRTVYYDGAYAPFGENYAETGTTDRSFTGQNQDITPGPVGCSTISCTGSSIRRKDAGFLPTRRASTPRI